MKSAILVSLFALLSLAITERESAACDSAIYWSLPLMIEKADRIVVATASSHTEAKIRKSLRGSVTDALPAGGSSCDPHFEPGNSYLLFTQAGSYFPDSAAVRLVGANGTRVLAFVEAFMKAKSNEQRAALRVETIRDEMLQPHAASFEYRLLNDALGSYPQGLVTTEVDRKARAVLSTASACVVRSELDWFERAAAAPNVGVFEATPKGYSLKAAWRGATVAPLMRDAVVGARYLLVWDSAQEPVPAPILLDGEAGDYVLALQEWFASPATSKSLEVLMEYVRKNHAASIRSSTCSYEAKHLVLEALARLEGKGYRWKVDDCRPLRALTQYLDPGDPVARSVHRRCKRHP